VRLDGAAPVHPTTGIEIMTILRAAVSLAAVAIASALAPLAGARGFVDVLDTPAQRSPLAAKSLMQAVTRAGDRLVAVGQRGHIVVSADGGTTWKQSAVPVSSDLTAVCFVDAKQGWAVGHDGVVLHTLDGGDTWRLQLDGRKANDLLLIAMKRNVDAEQGSNETKKLLGEAERYKEQGADKPFLDVWFEDAKNGFVVGAYNLIFRTRDGGTTWEPWFDRTDNPKFFNLHAIRPVGDSVYIAGESGLLLKLDPAAERFRALTVPYTGSFFGIAGAKASVLAFGLRGNVYRSDDAGASWVKVDVGLPSAVVAAVRTSRDATLLADVGGRVAATDDGGHTFTKVALKQPMPVAGLAEASDGRLALAGPRGVAITETGAP
jgi:photosystem II stability/assembly factor-like uncharacterized protein